MGHAVVQHRHLVTVLSEASLCMAGWLSGADLLPQLDLTVVGAEGLGSDLQIPTCSECSECSKEILSGRQYFCVMVDC